jgi:hypothetical protein
MAEQIVEVGEGFWNIRGPFRIAGVVDIGTQASLVRLASGNFLFLDAYGFGDAIREEIDGIVGDAAEIEAVINLHPFHTVHVERMHAQYPDAYLYGTRRHLQLFPELPWQEVCSEDEELHDWYADDLDFSLPQGVDFVSDNENVHFSSVLAYHHASRTIHVDDTLMYITLPRVLGVLGLRDRVSLHPTLSLALEKREGAAADFRAWARDLAEAWGEAENLCAAHAAALLADGNRGASSQARIERALARCESRLRSHERRYG